MKFGKPRFGCGRNIIMSRGISNSRRIMRIKGGSNLIFFEDKPTTAMNKAITGINAQRKIF